MDCDFHMLLYKDAVQVAKGVFGTAISAAAATESEESRRTPRDGRAYLSHGRQPFF